MEFCILSPIAGLDRYSRLSKRHLLLPQIRNEHYENFYVQRRQEGDTLILDNGAYEGQTDWGRLIACVEKYNPQICALPDYLLQGWQKTHKAAFEFLDRWYYAFPNTKWMYIPQSEPGDIMGFIDGLYRALDDSRVAYIGLPRALPLQISSDPRMRVNVARQIRQRRPTIGIHALGMMNGDIEELKALRPYIVSIDSNAPVWRGWCGVQLGGPWHEQPVDYNAPLPGYDSTILHNLEVVGVDCSRYRTGN